MAIANLFLDFLNRDSREIYGWYSNLSRERHTRCLTEALNVAAFLCGEFCVAPPGFFAECEIAQEAIARRSDYLTERILRWPLREANLEDYFEKKQREYSGVAERYEGLFGARGQRFLRRYSGALIARRTNIGDKIVAGWESGPDVGDPFWQQLIGGIPGGVVERLRRLPASVRGTGEAVTWEALAGGVERLTIPSWRRIREGLQHVYFAAYMEEFGLRVLEGLPLSRTDFGLAKGDLRYDYDNLRGALAGLGAWRAVAWMSSASLCSLRERSGYFLFRDAFDEAGASMGSRREVASLFARASKGGRLKSRWVSDLRQPIPEHGLPVLSPQLDEVDEALGSVGSRVLDILRGGESSTRFDSKSVVGFRGGKAMTQLRQGVDVGIYVALQMEREMLVDRWGLKRAFSESVWKGQVSGRIVALFGRDEMGRVPAAVSAMKFLYEFDPGLLIVAGIAGGMVAEGAQLGDVVVARSIADLASRKVLTAGGTNVPEFRPKEFAADPRLEGYLKSSDFSLRDWEQTVVRDGEWPDGRRPTLRFGTVASLDEVVSSAEWQGSLLAAWPKLVAVEMEAGGVCAAAKEFGKDVAVVRGISDLADPAKSDTDWRRRAMKGVALLLDSVFKAGGVFESSGVLTE